MEATYHPNLVLGEKGPSVVINRKGKLRPVYLQQSILDQACGPHCVYMAMLILKLVSRSQLLVMSKGDDEYHPLYESWLFAQDYWLHGTPVQGLIIMFSHFGKTLRLKARKSPPKKLWLDLTCENRKYELAIINIYNWMAKIDHWVLAIGLGGEEHDRTLLVLDPLNPPEKCRMQSGEIKLIDGQLIYFASGNVKWKIKINEALLVESKNAE